MHEASTRDVARLALRVQAITSLAQQLSRVEQRLETLEQGISNRPRDDTSTSNVGPWLPSRFHAGGSAET